MDMMWGKFQVCFRWLYTRVLSKRTSGKGQQGQQAGMGTTGPSGRGWQHKVKELVIASSSIGHQRRNRHERWTTSVLREPIKSIAKCTTKWTHDNLMTSQSMRCHDECFSQQPSHIWRHPSMEVKHFATWILTLLGLYSFSRAPTTINTCSFRNNWNFPKMIFKF